MPIGDTPVQKVISKDIFLAQVKVPRTKYFFDDYLTIGLIDQQYSVTFVIYTAGKTPEICKRRTESVNQFSYDIFQNKHKRRPVNYLVQQDNSLDIGHRIRNGWYYAFRQRRLACHFIRSVDLYNRFFQA